MLDLSNQNNNLRNRPLYEEVADQLRAQIFTENQVHTRDDLADLAVDELVEMTTLDEDAAKSLIMKAREHWFNV